MSKSKGRTGYIQRQGQLFEDAAVKKIGGDAVNLNDEAAKGMKGKQYPTYDVSSSTELASVKSHISGPEITANNKAAYLRDFNHMQGWDRAYDKNKHSPLTQDAERILQLDKGIPIPSEIKGASEEQVIDYLKHKTVLRIPDDHVEEVRKSLRENIEKLPENYFLPEKPTEEQIQSVLDRVKGAGLTSAEAKEQMNTQKSSENKQEREDYNAQSGEGKAAPAIEEPVEGSESQGKGELPGETGEEKVHSWQEDEDYSYGH